MAETKNIMIVGVGGQGTLLTSRILGGITVEAGYDVKLSEVHGMAQRGGSVVTYVRYGEKVAEPIVEEGQADVLIAFERLEALRYAHFLKKDGVIILMKGNYEGEIKVLNTYKNELNISTIDIINYDILSNENNRSLIVIKKNNESSKVVNYAKLLKQSENRKKKLNLK